MKKEEKITRVTAEEAAALAKIDGRTDWARVYAMTDEEIEAAADADDAELGLNIDWSKATVRFPDGRTLQVNLKAGEDSGEPETFDFDAFAAKKRDGLEPK